MPWYDYLKAVAVVNLSLSAWIYFAWDEYFDGHRCGRPFALSPGTRFLDYITWEVRHGDFGKPELRQQWMAELIRHGMGPQF